MASISDITIYLKAAKELDLNLALVGAHGRGKTATVKQYADSIGYTLITKILSAIEPTDMIGLPVESKYSDGDTSVTRSAYPEWLVAACDPDRKVVLFFDEFNNAERDVQASILNLIEDRKLDEMKLADTTQIIMAFNPPSIAPNGRRLAKATRDRICAVPIEDKKDSFKKYYKENDMSVLSQILDELDPIPSYDEEVSSFTYENAEFTYRSLEKSYKIVGYCIKNNIPDKIGIELVSGYGGNNGHILYKSMKQKLLDKNESDEFESVAEAGDAKTLVEFIRKTNYFDSMVEYNKIKSKVEFIEGCYSEEDFDWILDQIFNEEFINAYKA